jgi:hypothetical protein
MVLGIEKKQKVHAKAMKKNPEMEHADENQIRVQPGALGEIIWKFTGSGKVNFACLQPGHYVAGMKGAVVVGGKSMGDTPSNDLAHKHYFLNLFKGHFMKLSKYLFANFLVFSAACFTTVYAHDKHRSSADAVSAVSAGNMADGEIKKIDRDNKKMTIKHGDIKSLDMPGMTMVFQIRDTTILEAFKAGDKVKFIAEKLDGAFVVTGMQLAK